jgi:hypothetical protein
VSAPPAAGFQVTYDAALVEESVLLAERRLPAAEAAIFRDQRDRIYAAADPDEREARFEELHGRFFLQLGLDGPLHDALGELPELRRRARGCRVLPAVSRRDETADVRAPIGAPADAAPTIVVRLRSQSLLEPDALRLLLRRELAHVADVLDPAFGYVRELPGADGDPALVNLLRERYRVLWDASVDGRLRRAGLLDGHAREARLREFARAFPMLDENTAAAFARWFDGPRPTHAALVAFVQEPLGPGTGDEARCPLCRLPARALVRGALDARTARAIARDHSGWRPEQGRCARCTEAYEALVCARS